MRVLLLRAAVRLKTVDGEKLKKLFYDNLLPCLSSLGSKVMSVSVHATVATS